MKVISFNINGIRARLHQLQAVIDKHRPDIIGLQETKFMTTNSPWQMSRRWVITSFIGQKGHYGVAMLSKKPLETHSLATRLTMKTRSAE